MPFFNLFASILDFLAPIIAPVIQFVAPLIQPILAQFQPQGGQSQQPPPGPPIPSAEHMALVATMEARDEASNRAKIAQQKLTAQASLDLGRDLDQQYAPVKPGTFGGITPVGGGKGMSHAELRLLAKEFPAAKAAYRMVMNGEVPANLSNAEVAQRLARYGWSKPETAAVDTVLAALRNQQPDYSLNNMLKANAKLRYNLQSGDQGTPTSDIDKAVNTIVALQDVAEDYAVLLGLREINPVAVAEFEEEFREKWDGLNPDDAAWFADDGTVTLDEMIAMALAAEGGSIALSEEMIILLANRARTFVLGAKEIADQAELNWSQFMTAEGLLEAYALGDRSRPEFEVARRIINNVFAHDDSFFGAQDRDFERNVAVIRSQQKQITAWLNLTQNPEGVSSRYGAKILELAIQVADPDQWIPANTRTLNGKSVYTQANNSLINVDLLNAQLGYWGIDTVNADDAVEDAADGSQAIFLNFCQTLVHRRVSADILRLNGCIDCAKVRNLSPKDLVRADCMTCEEFRNDPGLQDFLKDSTCE